MKQLIAASIAASIVIVTTGLIACGPRVDVAKSLKIEGVTTGWHDTGSVAGKNKVVPLASFVLKNVSAERLPAVQVNAVFHRKGESGEWGTAFVTAAGSTGLTPGAEAEVTVRSQLGYTGTDPSDEMLYNTHFVDATVDIFAKYGSTQWTRVGEYPIDRTLRP
jgi:hypothetical protein